LKRIFILLIITLAVWQLQAQKVTTANSDATTVLYHKILNDNDTYPELLLNKVTCRFTDEGLVVTGHENVIQLNKYYALGERLVRYHIKFSSDAKVIFRSNTGDFKVIFNVPDQSVSIEATPVVRKSVVIQPKNDYLIDIQRTYQQSKVVITDVFTGITEELEINGDGSGGFGAGSVKPATGIVHQWDKYCFGLLEGTSFTMKQISVLAHECDLTLLIYGDSQSQPEGYFPAEDFSESWTQLIMDHVQAKAMSSGRGGGTITDVLERIKNELPYIKAKYVMVTIGTNGGNTEANLGELVEYILDQGSIPILNNIPCNEHGTQIEVNQVIERVRQKYGIKGCLFDLATSLDHDGKKVDNTTMWHEDYDFGRFYHHPNVKGSRLMFIRTLIDVPEIYE
jgi:hypothetical protein